MLSQSELKISVGGEPARLVSVDSDRVRVLLGPDVAPLPPGSTTTVALDGGDGSVLVQAIAGPTEPTGTDLYFVGADPFGFSPTVQRRNAVRIVPEEHEVEVVLETADGGLVPAQVADIAVGGLSLEHSPCRPTAVRLRLPNVPDPLVITLEARHFREVTPGHILAGYAFAFDRTEGGEAKCQAVGAFLDLYRMRIATLLAL